MAESYREALQRVGALLESPFEARVLIEESTSKRFSQLFSMLDAPMTTSERSTLDALAGRRSKGEPLQHVVGHWPFFTLELACDRRALIPRPETEVVVEAALAELERMAPARRARVLDLGTGSGAIALSIASERHDVVVVAVDRSREALGLARQNLRRCGTSVEERVRLVASNWADGLCPTSRFDLVVSNPPYLSRHEWEGLERSVRDFDPVGALIAGENGLEAITEVIGLAATRLSPGGSLVCEIAPDQAASAVALASASSASESFVSDDLAGRKRVLVARF